MDSIHDLGGRQGFGPIDTAEPHEPFHAQWEARLLGIVRAMSRPPGWTIDRFRFARESIAPVDYLTRPYYDQWLQTYAALLIDSGVATPRRDRQRQGWQGQGSWPRRTDDGRGGCHRQARHGRGSTGRSTALPAFSPATAS